MATGGREDPHTCPICLQDFRDPRFLPCHHTLCADCIVGLADYHRGGRFPCPACRKFTSLPPEGVIGLQHNFYIQAATSRDDMCPLHTNKELDLYCVECRESICINCKMTKHEGHHTDDLHTVTSRKRRGLQRDEQRLHNARSKIAKHDTWLQEKTQHLYKKTTALEKTVDNLRAVIVAAANRTTAKVRRSLQSVHTDLRSDIGRDSEQQEGHKVEITNLLQQVNHAMTSGTASDVMTVAEEMTNGRGSETSLEAMTSPIDRPFHIPVLQSDVSIDAVIQAIDGCLGTVRQVEMKETVPEVRVTECFQCAQDPDVEVFALCHVDADPPLVWVSYEQCGMMTDAPEKAFTETGGLVVTGTKVGKVSYKRIAKGQCMYPPPQPGRFVTHCKSPTAAHFSLANTLSGQADIDRATVTSTDPFKAETKTEFTIQVGPHRAFDVDDTEQYFAVVEEAKESTACRKVLLYRRSVEKAVSTYTPPTERCQPSDVCFYTLRGQKVLLITDERNDAIHVVTIHGDTMQFERFLYGSGGPLVQPTAITVDLHDRLWVACREGSVLMMERVD
ncbi:hypothetical protein ACOMHN_021432 [Nucella lapillus]